MVERSYGRSFQVDSKYTDNTDDGNGDVDDYSYVDTYDINLRDRNAEEKKEEAKRLEEVS